MSLSFDSTNSTVSSASSFTNNSGGDASSTNSNNSHLKNGGNTKNHLQQHANVARMRALNKRRSELARRQNDSMVYLGGPRVYSCIHCRTHLTTHDDIISKSFHGKQGRALLIDQCVNIELGRSEDRLLMTGLHKVADLNCKRCETCIGWTYLKAYERSQKYKEGKFIIEKIHLFEEQSPSYDMPSPSFYK